MPPTSPPLLTSPSLHRHPSNVSSSPSSTFDNAPGNHYLQQLDPEPELDLEREEPLSRTSTRNLPSSPPQPFRASQHSRSHSHSQPPNATRSPPLAHSSYNIAGNRHTMPYGVPSFYHSPANSPYNYNPSDVELSTIGMGMSMYETLNPLAATVMMSPGTAAVAGRTGKRGFYAPIDASYYSAYTQPSGPVYPNGGGGGGIVESIYGGVSTMFGFGNQPVNPRYISEKSDGAANGGRDREAVLKRVKREAGVFEEELRRLVGAQEVALGITPDASSNAAVSEAPTPRSSVYTTKSNGNGRKKMGIKEVRRGILDAMVGLADVKSVEEEWYAAEVSTRGDLVDMVEKWVRKRERLEKEVEKVENGEEGKDMDRIRERLEGVEEQIRVHEAELKRLRSEQTDMLSKISELQSTLSSRLSSYTSSIQKMSKDMTAFLRSPNALLPTPDTKATLPFTPEQAIDYWRDERNVLDGKKKDTSHELDALKDGVVIWQETVGLIADFESMMARELTEAQRRQEEERRKLERSRSPQVRNSMGVFGRGLQDAGDGRPGSSSASSGRNTPVSVFANRNRRGLHSRNGSLSSSTETFKPGAPNAPPKPPTPQPRIPEATAAKLVAGIDNVISQLNSRLTIAEQKGWTLLVCVLGAEMESYKEARAALVPLVGGLVDTSTTTETVARAKGKGKEREREKNTPSGLTSPSDDALNETLDGLSMGTSGQGYDGASTTNTTDHGAHQNHWHSESESEIDDPAALFGAEQPTDDGSSSPELRMSPRIRRWRNVSEEEDELEYAAFASLNLGDESKKAGGSGRSTVVGEGVRRSGATTTVGKLVDDSDKDDIHGAFLERRESEEKPGLI
ncbi:hypothetical protein ABW19_dt0208472 [Dactylella cylindrospora]|nr:hypothetical protein ABW19_dt0208472 [Dactylella cylindrospora]